MYAWYRIIVSVHAQFSLFSERWTYQNIMVSITFVINVAQRTYIRVIQVNVHIYIGNLLLVHLYFVNEILSLDLRISKCFSKQSYVNFL